MKSNVGLVGTLISIGAIICAIVLSHFESAGPPEQSLAADSCHCPQRLHL